MCLINCFGLFCLLFFTLVPIIWICLWKVWNLNNVETEKLNALALPEPWQSIGMRPQLHQLDGHSWNFASRATDANNLRPFRNHTAASSCFWTSQHRYFQLSYVCGRSLAVVPGCLASSAPCFLMSISKLSCRLHELSVILPVNYIFTLVHQSPLFSTQTLDRISQNSFSWSEIVWRFASDFIYIF